MAERRIKRALISVYDKTGIVDFARALVDEFGIEIISTGGTAALLKENGIPVTLVEQITGFPEMLDGRVKTLHPKIHAAILADRDNPEHMRQLKEQGIEPIDMVVVNLYPFEKTVADPNCTFEQAIEMIDIGGPCLLRAAAKNHRHVIVCCRPEMYAVLVERLRAGNPKPGPVDHRVCGALDAFWKSSTYDGEIHTWLHNRDYHRKWRERLLRLVDAQPLRYGENPHQQAEYYGLNADPRFHRLFVKFPKAADEMSFNNYLDASAAQDLVEELGKAFPGQSLRPSCVLLKHTNPCGAATHEDPIEAYRMAYLADPHAAMGGVLAVNFRVDIAFAEAVMGSLARWGKSAGAAAFFLDVWLAPSMDRATLEFIETRKEWGKKVRLLETDTSEDPFVGKEALDFRQIVGGVLVQEPDSIGLNEDQWKVVTKRVPSESEISDLRLAWLIAKHTKSNAVSMCKGGMLIGNGAGQMSRVMSCRIATWLAKENGHADKLSGSVAASDAFFPFADGPNILIDAGVTAIIQPGGSKRDAEVIAACDARNVGMIFTGTRHFKH